MSATKKETEQPVSSFSIEGQVNADYSHVREDFQQSGVSFPNIMAFDYEPKPDQQIPLVLIKKNWEEMSDVVKAQLDLTEGITRFNKNSTEVMKGIEKCRFVVLTYPKVYGMSRIDDREVISPLQQNENFSQSGRKSVARVFLALITPDNELVIDESGDPQIFTLKLTSTKVSLFLYQTKDKSAKTLNDLCDALAEAYNKESNEFLAHLVSVRITAEHCIFGSKAKGFSDGCKFVLDGSARALKPEIQQKINDFINTKKNKDLFKDPFRLGKPEIANDSENVVSDGDELAGIPF